MHFSNTENMLLRRVSTPTYFSKHGSAAGTARVPRTESHPLRSLAGSWLHITSHEFSPLGGHPLAGKRRWNSHRILLFLPNSGQMTVLWALKTTIVYVQSQTWPTMI